MKDPRPARRTGWSAGPGYGGHFDYVDDPRLAELARDLERDFPVQVQQQWPVRSLRVHCVVVRFSRSVQATIGALEADHRVEWVQPLNEFEGSSSTRASANGSDPYRRLQSSLDILNTGPLKGRFTGAGVHVVIVDSGVEADHPDLRHALQERLEFTAGGGANERHGTGVAGVLAAADGNGEGIAGVAPAARLHGYRACWETDLGTTRCNSLTLSLALDRAIALRPHIINLSLSGPADRLLDSLVDRLIENDAIVVAAHDDDLRGGPRFPRPRTGVVQVRNGSQLTEALPGQVYAPGEAVLTAQPGHSYDFMSGSSLAAAHVSGVLALMLQAGPDTAPAAATGAMSKTVKVSNAGASIDACLAVQAVHTSFRCPTDAPGSVDQVADTQ